MALGRAVLNRPASIVCGEAELLIIFDLDGTLVIGPPGRIANTAEEQSFLPGVLDACEHYRGRGDTLAIASNQGGVALGYLTLSDAHRRVEQAALTIGADHFRFCPFHPEGTIPEFAKDADCRKPKPGMLYELMGEVGASSEDTLFVGDSPEDEEAAEAAGVSFEWRDDFFETWA